MCVLLASFIFALSAVLVKLCGREVPVTEITLARSTVSIVVGVSSALSRGEPLTMGKRENYHLLLMRGVFGSCSMIFRYEAFVLIPLADAVTIAFISPITTALLSALALGEHAGPPTYVGGVVALAGVALISKPGFAFGPGRPLHWLGDWADHARRKLLENGNGARKLLSEGPLASGARTFLWNATRRVQEILPVAAAAASSGTVVGGAVEGGTILEGASGASVLGGALGGAGVAGGSTDLFAASDAGQALGLGGSGLPAPISSTSSSASAPSGTSPAAIAALGASVAFVSALLTSMNHVTVRHIGTRERAVTITYWFHACSILITIVPLIVGFPAPARWPSPKALVFLVGVGLTSFAAQLLQSRAFQIAPAAKISAFAFTQVPYAALLGALVFGDAVGPLLAVGAVCIAVGVVLVGRDGAKAVRATGGPGGRPLEPTLVEERAEDDRPAALDDGRDDRPLDGTPAPPPPARAALASVANALPRAVRNVFPFSFLGTRSHAGFQRLPTDEDHPEGLELAGLSGLSSASTLSLPSVTGRGSSGAASVPVERNATLSGSENTHNTSQTATPPSPTPVTSTTATGATASRSRT